MGTPIARIAELLGARKHRCSWCKQYFPAELEWTGEGRFCSDEHAAEQQHALAY